MSSFFRKSARGKSSWEGRGSVLSSFFPRSHAGAFLS